jgi:hypothetical protein
MSFQIHVKVLTPRTSEYNWVVRDTITMRLHKSRVIHGLVWLVSIYKKEVFGQRTCIQGECPMNTEAVCHKPWTSKQLGDRLGTDDTGGSMSCQHLDLSSPDTRTETINSCCFKKVSLWYFLMTALGNKYRTNAWKSGQISYYYSPDLRE